MKARLMYRDRDFDPEGALPGHASDLTQDLELDRLLSAMAGGDELLLDVATRAVLSGLEDPLAIAYRQEILRDCLDHPSVVRDIYDVAVEAIQRERRDYLGAYSTSVGTILHRSVRVLEMFMELLRRLREISDEHAPSFGSEGFRALFTTLSAELDDAYLQTVDDRLHELRFRHGVLISAGLGAGSKGTGYVLRRPREQGWRERLSSVMERSSQSFQIADRDEAGIRALAELRGRGIALVADALAQSTDHISSFFRMLRTELAFYVGCLNLHGRLAEQGEPTCLPEPLAAGTPELSARGLYDVGLSLTVGERVIGNDVSASGKRLVMITGANQGGKSTFLRSVGLAQLMMQCGMFVGAESFSADVRHGVFTHFRRGEDTTMKSGKFDEELVRMSGIVDSIGPDGLLLCNESFASTNEREGSEIARQIVRAMLEAGVKVFFVTHMFDLADGFHAQGSDHSLFLRAERESDGRRTFRVVEGEPLATSYGEDLYRRIFAPSS